MTTTPCQLGPLDREEAGLAIERLLRVTPRWARPTIIVFLTATDAALLVVINDHRHANVELELLALHARPCPPFAGVIAGTRARLEGLAIAVWLAGDDPEGPPLHERAVGA
jgi:hypothetical protein